MAIYREKNIELVNRRVLESFVGVDINYYTSVVVSFYDSVGINYIASSQNGEINPRSQVVVDYVHHLLSDLGGAKKLYGSRAFSRFIFQGDDRPKDKRSSSWQTKRGYSNVCLLPDFYYVSNRGYRNFFPNDVPDWRDRQSTFFWRGSTTGGWALTPETITGLQRYRLCEIGSTISKGVDFAFYDVSQALSPESKKDIEDIFLRKNMLRSYSPLHTYIRYKYFVQIDGNGNSWELIPKLRLGSCMLMVESDWVLWHHYLLKPWEHYVPVRSDLSNLAEVIDWCQSHEEEAARIAAAGRALALSIDYDQEMSDAVDCLCRNVDMGA